VTDAVLHGLCFDKRIRTLQGFGPAGLGRGRIANRGPLIRVDRQVIVDQDAEAVWARLADFPAMVSILPGVTGWAAPSPDRFTAKLGGRLAFMAIRATVDLRVVQREKPWRMSVDGAVFRGEGDVTRAGKPWLGVPSWIEFALRWELSPSARLTLLRYHLELTAGAALERWIEPIVESRLNRFEARLVRLMTSRAQAGCAAA
jgi:carbon monoxide dehydrogenase subunit G